MQRINSAITTVLMATIGGALLSLMMPLTATGERTGWIIFHMDIMLTIVYAGLFALAALLFLLGLGAFKQELRRAYVKISLGVVLFGLSFAQILVINLFDLWGSAWAASGLVALPFAAAGWLLFLGVRRYGLLVGVRGPWTRFWFVLAAALGGAVLAAFLPHVSAPRRELDLDLNNGLLTVIMVLVLAAAMIILAIKKRTGAIYNNALAWMFMALLVVVVSDLGFIAISLAGLAESAFGYLLLDAMLVVSGVMLARAGYTFSRLSE